jgi:hypothetical protein
MKAQYVPARDELILKIHPVKGKANKKIGPFELWWDKEGNILAIAILSYIEELKEFREKRGWIQLGGIWKGIKIDEEDIKEARQELLKKIEERWERF